MLRRRYTFLAGVPTARSLILLASLTNRYHKAGKTVRLQHLSPDCRSLLKNAEAIIDVNILEDPLYLVTEKA